MSSRRTMKRGEPTLWVSLRGSRLLRLASISDVLLPLAMVMVAVLAYVAGKAPLVMVPTLSAPLAVLGLLRIPSSVVMVLAKLSYYSELDKEMPLILALFQATASSGAGLDEVFSTASRFEGFRYFRVECDKYRLMRALGRTWEESIEELEKDAPHSSKYKAFLRGLLSTTRTSLRLPEYIDSFLEDYLLTLESSWKAFWERAGTLVESMMLLSLCFVTLYIVASLIRPEAIGTLSTVFSLLVLATGLVGAYVLRLSRPLPSIIPLKRKRFTLLMVTPWTLFLLILLVFPQDRLELIVLTSGAILAIGGLLQRLDAARAKTLEERKLQLLRSVEELMKVGYSIKSAITRLESKNEGIPLVEPAVTTFLTRLTQFVLECVRLYGWVTQSFVSRLVSTVKRLVSMEKAFKATSTGLVYMGILLPALLALLTVKAFGYFLLPLASTSGVLVVYAAMCVVTNMITSEATEGFFLFSFKVGVSLIALFLAHTLATTLSI